MAGGSPHLRGDKVDRLRLDPRVVDGGALRRVQGQLGGSSLSLGPLCCRTNAHWRLRFSNGEEQAKEPSRLVRQLTVTLSQMFGGPADVGTKRNVKLHVGTADGGLPLSCIMTSALTIPS